MNVVFETSVKKEQETNLLRCQDCDAKLLEIQIRKMRLTFSLTLDSDKIWLVEISAFLGRIGFLDAICSVT